MEHAPEDIAQHVKKKARNLGFDDCRICSADPPSAQEQQAFGDWLDQGMNGSMGWFERSRKARLDIRSRFPWARSVIVLRLDYAADQPDAPDNTLAKRIARYAQTADYHDVHAERLEKLARYVSRFDDRIADYQHAKTPAKPGGSQAIPYQDTGPVLEHVYAQRAGIGWTGKHTLTLHQEHGSWFFLAEIITSLELPVDQSAENHCGTCTACIDACPTNALLEPYKLDARRCISYLTIEHDGLVDTALRNQLAGWIYGCDICQQVCPWNKKRAERPGKRTPGSAQHEPWTRLTLLDVLMERDARLEEVLAGTPQARTGVVNLKRNSALVVGSEQIAAAIKGLEHCMTHPEPALRLTCAWSLGCFAGTPLATRARQALSTHLKRESDENVREEVIEALQKVTNQNSYS